MFRKVDCIQLYVDNLAAGLAFYRDQLGHELIWRSATQAGLRLPDTDAELVLQTERPEPEIDLLVDSVDQAIQHIEAAGGQIIVAPFDIRVGRCAVISDAWNNKLVLLDMSKGPLRTDSTSYVIEADGDGT